MPVACFRVSMNPQTGRPRSRVLVLVLGPRGPCRERMARPPSPVFRGLRAMRHVVHAKAPQLRPAADPTELDAFLLPPCALSDIREEEVYTGDDGSAILGARGGRRYRGQAD